MKKRIDNVKIRKFCSAKDNCWEMKGLWKTIWKFLTKLNIFLLYDLAIVFFGI